MTFPEKETLSIVFTLERFHQYVYGRKTSSGEKTIIVAVMKNKTTKTIKTNKINKRPSRTPRFILRMQLYDL